MKLRFSVFLTCLLLFYACTSGDKLPSSSGDDSGQAQRDFGSFVVNEGVKYLDAHRCEYVRIIDENTLQIGADLEQAYKPSVGEIVLCAQSDQTPYGFMGRVCRIDGNTYFFEDTRLEEVFETFTFDSVLDITPYLEDPVDEDGEPMDDVQSSEAVWDGYNYDSTKAPVSKAVSVGIVNDFFDGRLYTTATMDTRIKIQKGQIEVFHLAISKRCGIEGVFSIDKQKSKDVKFKSLTFPLGAGIPVGPIILRPMMNISAGIKLDGEISLSGMATMELENSIYTIDYEGGSLKYGQESADNSLFFSFTLVEIEASLSPYIKGGVQVAVYQKDLLSVGVEVEGELKMEASSAVRLENKQLLIDNPTIRVTPQVKGTAYLSSVFLGKKDEGKGRLQVEKTQSLSVVELPILPTFSGGKLTRGPEFFAIDISFDSRSAMRPEEVGIACYAGGASEPVALLPLSDGVFTKASRDAHVIYEGDASYARPYVKASDGTVFYGEKIGSSLIKSLVNTCNDSYVFSYSFSYDNEERLVTALGDLYGNFRFKYGDSILSVETFTDENVTSPWGEYYLGEDGRLLRNSYGDFFNYDSNGMLCDMNNPGMYYAEGGDFVDFFGHSITYTDIVDPLNLDIFNTFYITDLTLPPLVRFPGLWSKHLPSKIGDFEVSYVFEDGNVVSIRIYATYYNPLNQQQEYSDMLFQLEYY